jgi:hypothetical protein
VGVTLDHKQTPTVIEIDRNRMNNIRRGGKLGDD